MRMRNPFTPSRRRWLDTATYYVVAPHIDHNTKARIAMGLPWTEYGERRITDSFGRPISLPRVSILEKYDEKGNPR